MYVCVCVRACLCMFGCLGLFETACCHAASRSSAESESVCVFLPLQLAALASTGKFNFVVKLHGRCHRVLDADVTTVTAPDQYLNPLSETEAENVFALKSIPGVTIVPLYHHNLLPFINAFDVVRKRVHVSFDMI